VLGEIGEALASIDDIGALVDKVLTCWRTDYIFPPMNLDSMPDACPIRATASLQVKNIPDKLRQRLQRYAREYKCTLGEVVLTAVERELARSEWSKCFAHRPTTELGVSAALLLKQERQQRKSDLGLKQAGSKPTRELSMDGTRR